MKYNYHLMTEEMYTDMLKIACELYNDKKYDESIASYDDAINMDPDKSIAYICKGETYRELGENEKALECFNKIVDLKPDEFTAWGFYKRAYLLHQLGKGHEAIANLNRVLELDPNYESAHFSKAVILNEIYMMTKKPDMLKQSIHCYDEAIKTDPKDFAALYNKGLLLEKENMESEAIECFDEAIKIDPSKDVVHAEKGCVLLVLSQYEKAIVCFDEAIRLNPDYASAMYNKAKSLYLLDKIDESKYWLEKALKLDPELPDCKKLISMLNERIKFNNSLHDSCKMDHDEK